MCKGYWNIKKEMELFGITKEDLEEFDFSKELKKLKNKKE
jgi:hypothetical protein